MRQRSRVNRRYINLVDRERPDVVREAEALLVSCDTRRVRAIPELEEADADVEAQLLESSPLGPELAALFLTDVCPN